ncbi:Cephalosporin hydroxylase [Algoriphagus faecimaris]|uniref:Cephalosporin hydroxylase n=1 Tax=Algoriphagus faecimaris TaxID=686796 RepID=A0A1G6PXC5_9BACT|nr:methyltransferase [Algoriphagus faecimaris]SDC84176.1 Cephalosporin hydroxylase [Algoriphagus faecimaris]
MLNFSNISFKRRRKLIRLYNRVRTFGKTNDLNFLATTFKTDKWGKHFYTPHYYFHFKRFKSKKIKVLEIGIGGYEDPQQGGGSLRMWERFFDRAEIHGIDIYDKTQLEEGRIKIKTGSQVDQAFLESLSDSVGGFEIIIDDGSHINEHIIKSFEILFPKLKDGGIYVIEDVQTSYWPEYGGNPENPDNFTTAVGYFKKFIHGLNHAEFPDSKYEPNYFDKKITSIHFYHNLIFIYKGDNNEGSNVI